MVAKVRDFAKNHSNCSLQPSVKPIFFFQPNPTAKTCDDTNEQVVDHKHSGQTVMRLKEGNEPISLTPITDIQRQCVGCKKKEKEQMQHKETAGGSAGGKAVPSIVYNVLSAGGGHHIDANTRQIMENRFGQDFGQVHIYAGGHAADSAAAIQARAYTSGRNIVFGAGENQPGSAEGKRLLAHELVHVIQQNNTKNANAVQRQLGNTRPTQAPPTPNPCSGQADITADFRTYMRIVPPLLPRAIQDPNQLREAQSMVRTIIARERGIDLLQMTVISCTSFYSPLSLPGESIKAYVDESSNTVAVNKEDWRAFLNFPTTLSLETDLVPFLQILAHEKRHATLGGTVSVPASGLQPEVSSYGSAQAAYRIEEILVNAEEIAVGRRILGDNYRVPLDTQIALMKYWNIAKHLVTPEETARLRALLLTKLRQRYGYANQCDNALTAGILTSMEFGRWHFCSRTDGRVQHSLANGITNCREPNGLDSVCGTP